MNFSYELTLVVLYSIQKFVKIECADIDDVSVVDDVFNRIVKNFLTNLPWYYLTPYQNLLRLNVIFMVRNIGQL